VAIMSLNTRQGPPMPPSPTLTARDRRILAGHAAGATILALALAEEVDPAVVRRLRSNPARPHPPLERRPPPTPPSRDAQKERPPPEPPPDATPSAASRCRIPLPGIAAEGDRTPNGRLLVRQSGFARTRAASTRPRRGGRSALQRGTGVRCGGTEGGGQGRAGSGAAS
jgi:hypothetical protein